MERLDNTVQAYAWGSRSAIAALQGRPVPSPGPEAELWMGAHPVAPSRVQRAGATLRLDHAIDAAPERELGAACVAAFGAKLPFLLKILAAAAPLSLQAHPSREQARAGFAREEAAGIERTAPERCYRDESHKPELLCALGPFTALCGFRRAEDSAALFSLLDVEPLAAVRAALLKGEDGLRPAFEHVMSLQGDERARAVDATLASCHRNASDARFGGELGWALRLGELYPGDAGIISALLLNLIHLAPGDAIYLPAGNLHAYLDGVGVEIMASSDNVLRGGLTPKHVDVAELLRVLEFCSGPVAVLQPEVVDATERLYVTPASEFRLSVLTLGETPVTRSPSGPEILICTEGSAQCQWVGGILSLAAGEAAFVAGTHPEFSLIVTGRVFRARTGVTDAPR